MALFTKYTLNTKTYLGIIFGGTSCLLYFKNKKFYNYFFGIVLVLGVFNLLDVYYINMKLGIGPFVFNPIFTVLLVVFAAFNKEILNLLFPKNNNSDSPN
ncbi:hypothetical protein [Tenacibaculum sp. MEBiC07804]